MDIFVPLEKTNEKILFYFTLYLLHVNVSLSSTFHFCSTNCNDFYMYSVLPSKDVLFSQIQQGMEFFRNTVFCKAHVYLLLSGKAVHFLILSILHSFLFP